MLNPFGRIPPYYHRVYKCAPSEEERAAEQERLHEHTKLVSEWNAKVFQPILNSKR